MSFLRNVLHDLVEKKLWPVSVALLIALVAVPVVVGRDSNHAADVVPTTKGGAAAGLANRPDAAREQVISLEQQAAGRSSGPERCATPLSSTTCRSP
ncbi:hypothetical protein FSW04_18565 [Baekduia soli]|uniref:Uncharacterized protein n=1 Tax=Baekduia soli TaxID=496014 RepID=A0A5B8U8Q9_9ACTN|nr:hypothetical protein [Baekduia soli]QEC49375.1 hypothetical protein FSW04_18565 [Baekduia soli]